VFVAVFSIFLLAIVVLCVVTIRWAVHRDRERRTNADPSQSEKR
jgi:cell division protein FtsL